MRKLVAEHPAMLKSVYIAFDIGSGHLKANARTEDHTSFPTKLVSFDHFDN